MKLVNDRMLKEIWYIKISGGVEGPFSFDQLNVDERISPDTPVWRKGFDEWKPIKEVPELDDLFSEEPVPEIDDEAGESDSPIIDDEIAIDDRYEPPIFLYWILIILILLTGLLYNYFIRQ